MPWAMLGASLGSAAIGGIGNYFANQSAQDRAAALQNQSLQNWMQVNIPDPAQQKLAFQQFVQQGTFTPQLEQAIKADPSAFQGIVTNQQNKNAQSRALQELQSIGDQGGLRIQDKAALQDALMAQQTKDRSDRQTIAANMAQRGLGASGFDVAAQLAGQQATSDQAARNSLSVAGSAQDRALQAIMGAGNLGTQYRTQDFNEQAQRAQAADRINMFNTQNLQSTNNANVGLQNAAQAQNLAEKQRVSDQNTLLSNQQQQSNAQLLQQQYENQAKKAAGLSGQYQNLAGTAAQQGQNLGNTISNIGLAGSNAANSALLFNYLDKQKQDQNQSEYQLPSDLQDSINKIKKQSTSGIYYGG